MSGHTVAYFAAPHGFADRAVKLINLPTVNYILWGLQVGLFGPKKTRWRSFFNHLTRTGFRLDTATIDEDVVWNFIQTYLRPFAVQHGGDQQGGMHEGDTNRVVTHGAVDYVSSFAIEGKLRHVNNLWRDHDVRENDDLILALRHKAPPHSDLQFVLSSSVRATRNERVPVNGGFYYLRPEVLQHRSFSDVPYIHIGRSQLYCSAYTRGVEACCWNARMPVTPGAPLLMTFEPCFVGSDRMFYRMHEIEDDDDDADAAVTDTLGSTSSGGPAAVVAGAGPAEPSAGATHHVRISRTGAQLPPAPPPPPPTPPVASTGQGMEPKAPKRRKAVGFTASAVASMLNGGTLLSAVPEEPPADPPVQ
jgi:hypothetical protein